MEVVLDAVGLEVAHAGAGHGRDPAAGDEEDAHQGQVADALQGVGGDRLQQGDRLPLGQGRRGVLLDAGGLDRGDVLGRLPGDQPLGGELLVGAAEHREPPGHRGRRPAGLEQRSLVELDVVGGDLQRGHPLGLHVPQEVHEVAAIGLDRVVRQQGVADPGHQGPGGGRGIAAGGLQGVGQEGFDLGRGRGVAFQEVAPLGHERGAGRGGLGVRSAGRRGDSHVVMGGMESILPRYRMKGGT